MTLGRIIASIFLFLAVLVLPYWLYLPLIVVAIVFFPFFWEAVLLGFIIDTMYSSSSGFLSFSTLAFTAAILVLLMLPVRNRIRTRA